ncbi:hypothetical protein JOC78_000550 [Bacillus ectoiniformans]|uniref:hypothetical protein n=1 Tax=Bacillus ectoiniformans TaxID=1494429 RepID=UPI0019572FCA|nr:hypothetical protein [Bacillus ectoiniformans]MBM7647629.1 hypothetical protein [Bacillus ectoiniformans]
MNREQQNLSFLPDTHFEGKDKAYLDIDRMINEGLSGGSVHMRDTQVTSNIEEALTFSEESPPIQQ